MDDKDFFSQIKYLDSKSSSPVKSVEHEHLDKMRSKKKYPDLNQSLAQIPGLQQTANNPLNKYGGAIGIGIGQGALNNANSILNTPSDTINMFGGNVNRVPNLDISQYAPQDPLSQTLEKGGEIAGEIGTGLGGYKAAGSALNLGAETPVYQRMLQGAVSGYVQSGSSDPTEAYNLPSSRLIGAAAGGALGGLGQLSDKALADRLSAIRKREKDSASAGYNSLFDTAKERGITDKSMKIPSIDMEDLNKNLSAKYRPSVQRYMSNPNLETAHKAQSDIGKMINDIYSKKGGLTSSQIDAYPMLQDAQKRLRGQMVGHLSKHDSSDLADLYAALTKNYSQNVAPYNIDALKKYSNDRKRPGSVMSEIYSKSNEPFMLAKGDSIPAIKAGEHLNKLTPLMKHLLGYAAMGGAYNLTKGNQ
jgi:hypothetical protein